MKRKVAIVAGFWVVQTLVMFAVGALFNATITGTARSGGPAYTWPAWSALRSILSDRWFYESGGWIALAMAAAQAVFLWPVRRPTMKDASGLSVFLSLGVAGGMLAILVTGAVLTALAVLDTATDVNLDQYGLSWNFMVYGSLGVSWTAGTFVLWQFCRRGSREAVLSRIASRLLLGTIVETAAIIPLDVLVRRRESCYCWAGTYIALIGCGALGLCLFGPAILLPLLMKRRRRWYEGRCDACGYDMRALGGADRCPECGAGWRAA